MIRQRTRPCGQGRRGAAEARSPTRRLLNMKGIAGASESARVSYSQRQRQAGCESKLNTAAPRVPCSWFNASPKQSPDIKWPLIEGPVNLYYGRTYRRPGVTVGYPIRVHLLRRSNLVEPYGGSRRQSANCTSHRRSKSCAPWQSTDQI